MAGNVTLISPDSGRVSAWQPRLGENGESLAARQRGLSEEERDRLLVEAQSILASAQPPGEHGSRTILAVGRVQSGKTLNYEMVTALARDNGFALVIVIAGISKFLERQTRRRLSRDLAVDDPTTQAFERWLLLGSSQLLDGDDLGLPVVLDAWRQREKGDDLPPTAVIVTLKHYRHIEEVERVIPAGFSAPTLIIDDEADQASLNANARRPTRVPTTTYRSLDQLRGRLRCHTYIQYTATPQANLLLAAADTLAPDAVRLLTPGADYVGNEEFRDDSRLIRRIPDSEAAVFDPQVRLTEPPKSLLLEAIDAFVVAAALGRRNASVDGCGPPRPPQLSMLVHPERLVSEHSKAARWVRSRLHALRVFDDDALAHALEAALSELRETAGRSDTPASSAELVPEIRRTLNLLDVIVLNRGDEGYSGEAGEDIPWHTKYAWVVVGGQMVDRGVTIPDLAITYIPRQPGENVDTVQQRARWLGYKRPYLDRCRLWMTDGGREFFTDYAEHEAQMHQEVERIVAEGIPLKEWRRQFLLDPQRRLTRQSVVSRDMQSRSLREWQQLLSLGPGDPPDHRAQAQMRELEQQVRQLPGFGSHEDHGHPWCDCTLAQALEVVELLPVHGPDDADDKALLLGHIARRIDKEGTDADAARIYLMDGLDPSRPRLRGVNEDGDPVEIKALLQGRNPRGGYPGDREMRRWEGGSPQLTLQLHGVRPTRGRRGGPPLWPGDLTTIVLAAYIPPGTDPGWVIEGT